MHDKTELICLQMEKRMDAIQKWLSLDDATVQDWKVWSLFFYKMIDIHHKLKQ